MNLYQIVYEMMKKNILPNIKKILPTICAGTIAVIMVLCAEISGEKEIIFPEIAALAIGYLVAPKRSWHVNSVRMFVLIAVCSVSGVLIVRYLSWEPAVEVMVAFALAQILFMYSGTTFAPFVSAIVLPVMLRTTSFIYPVAAMVLTFAIIGFHQLFIRAGILQDEDYKPVFLNTRNDWIDTVIRIAVVCLMGVAVFSLDIKYIIAPPLLVAFTEFSRPGNRARNMPVKTVALLSFLALSGAFCRWVFCISLGLPMTVATVMIIAIVLLTVQKTKMYMPPAGAIAILSMLIPEEAVLLYPLEIFFAVPV